MEKEFTKVCKRIQQFELLYVFHAPPHRKIGPYRKRKNWDHFFWHGHNARGGCNLVVADPTLHDAALMGGGGGSYWVLVIKGINYSKNVTKNGVPKNIGGVGKNFSN